MICDQPGRVHSVLLAHQHSFYTTDTPEDAERRAFHEGVIITELKGQREFSWGEVLCQFSYRANKNWLVVVYTPELPVPRRPSSVLRQLFAHEQPGATKRAAP